MKQHKTTAIIKFGMGTLILVPALLVSWFAGRWNRYHSLLREYECNEQSCTADFDGDGVSGRLVIDHNAPAPDFDSWILVKDSNKEILRQPRRSIDNSLKTHVAIVHEGNRSRVIIYDHIFDHNPIRSLVFEFDGNTMIPQSPTPLDQEVLAAMGAADETGSYERWALFQVFVLPALICYYGLCLWRWRVLKRVS